MNDCQATALPFPGALVSEGEYETQYLVIHDKKGDILKEYCRAFKLPVSGTIFQLKERLTAFSANCDGWAEGMAAGARRAHKGPRVGSRKSSMKTSTQRRDDMFNVLNSNTTQALPESSATHGLKDHRSPEEIHGFSTWAGTIADEYPYEPPLLPEMEVSLGKPSPTEGGSALYETMNLATTQMSKILIHLEREDVGSRNSQNGNAGVTNPGSSERLYENQVMSPEPPALPALSTNVHSRLPCPSFPALLTSGCDVPTSNTVPRKRSKTETRTLSLGDGTVLRYNEGDVPDPPAVSFTENIPRLDRIWDDTSPQWEPKDAVLWIKSHPIAVAHWPNVYRHWKAGQWKGTKAKWFEWKMLIQRWRQGTPAEFWAVFSKNKKNLSFTAILAHLAKERVAEDAAICEIAKREYAATWDEDFGYRKNSQKFVLTKPALIAKRYQKLKGISM